jgi:lactate dehydrogenase-like 2-hydroxyacid dehydrogenase
MKVVIIEGHRPSLMPEGPVIEKNILGKNTEIFWYANIPAEKKQQILSEANAVIARPGTLFGAEEIALLKNAQVIVSIGVGFDHIDIKAARAKGIDVCNVPDYGTEEVAVTSVAMALSLHRKLHHFKHHFELEKKSWDWKILEPIKRLSECRIGILGLGRIGTCAALKFKAFSPHVAFYDPYIPRGQEKALGLRRIHLLDELLATSDIVSVHVPHTNETEGMINKKFLESMPPHGILINCSRGALYQNLDILESHLKHHPHFSLGTDVLPIEPPQDHSLLKAYENNETWLKERLLINPHSAFYSESSVVEIRKFAAEIIHQVFQGKRAYNIVN